MDRLLDRDIRKRRCLHRCDRLARRLERTEGSFAHPCGAIGNSDHSCHRNCAVAALAGVLFGRDREIQILGIFEHERCNTDEIALRVEQAPAG